jgi:hypothetical protein
MYSLSTREDSRPTRRLRAAIVAAALVAGLAAATAPAASAAVPVQLVGASSAVSAAAATVAVTPSSTAIKYGSSFSVTVTAAGQTSGTIALRSGSTALGTKAVSAGRATFTVPGTALTVGRHPLTATFSGGGTASKAVDIVKVKPVFHLALAKATVPSGSPTKVTVAVSAGSAAASGKVKLVVDGVARTAARLSGGRAVMTLPGLSAGVHTVTGVYTGEGGFLSTTSPVVRLTSTGKSTTTITISSCRVSYGSSAPIKVTVTGPKGAAGGRVDVLLSGSVLGAKNLSGGKATWTVPGRAPGRYTITARYAGAGVAQKSVANKAIDIVKARPAVSVSLSSSTIGVGARGHVTFSVSGGGVSPTGTYRVLVDGRAVASGNLSGGRGSATLPTLGAGSHSVAVSYGGDARYTAVTSAARSVSVASNSQCPASARVCVDLTNSRAWIQSGGKIVYGPVAITSGSPGYRTASGTFAVYWKDKDHKSSIFNDAPMPNSVFFDGGNAFHEGSLYVPSHGCIHLSWEASEYFYSNLDYGDTVVVFGYAPY